MTLEMVEAALRRVGLGDALITVNNDTGEVIIFTKRKIEQHSFISAYDGQLCTYETLEPFGYSALEDDSVWIDG